MSQEEKDKLQLLKKSFYKLLFRYIAIFLLFCAHFLAVRYFIPNEKISPLVIFPVFIILLIMSVKTIKQASQIKREIQEIKRST
ncbi:hypothetical protein QWZ08_16270 [Ferruginibacter paludis]|uniref:hypothetical protein n=1 Tax=Ferruginibacter paludis TaxID=1310417 RepID=UPI0025B33365|nr:hypothetical protein [Ferruginibacter paludis]MDN3657206.1 hypothetical protein [Ferruginibacter paludis]